ncbi:hypothetical protein XENOCAPTIV_028780 [Xenoophorus captivus]|uniref:Uncharacterized protein n=1 Tax=Xenoophorus captivus TaxID=1517983 RepID=A0ABV0RE06_9TELE
MNKLLLVAPHKISDSAVKRIKRLSTSQGELRDHQKDLEETDSFTLETVSNALNYSGLYAHSLSRTPLLKKKVLSCLRFAAEDLHTPVTYRECIIGQIRPKLNCLDVFGGRMVLHMPPKTSRQKWRLKLRTSWCGLSNGMWQILYN